MYRLFAALFLCAAMFLMTPTSAEAHGGCGYGGGGYYGGYYPRVNSSFYAPAYGYGYRGYSYGPSVGYGYSRGGFYGGRGGYYGGRGGSFISIGFGF